MANIVFKVLNKKNKKGHGATIKEILKDDFIRV
jgi:hypothetical protein